MHRRTLLRICLTAFVIGACATSPPPLTGPGLVFVYTDN